MNTSERIGVGVIGASTLNSGWAVTAHIPALQTLPEYELRAVSTSRRDSAAAAAAAFGVEASFDDARKLIAQPGVDLVVVAVKVPQHHKLVTDALEAGKMVMCEWPVGVSLAQTLELSALAEAKRVRTLVGLQARFAPAIRYARDLVAEGYVGEVLATTLVGSGIAWGSVSDRAHAYLFDSTNGATTLSVPTLHALDAVTFVLGDVAEVSSMLAVRRKTVRLADDDVDLRVSAPDHVAIAGRLKNGALASVFYRGGVSRGENLRWEINGSEGDLVLTSPIGNLQVINPKLEGGRAKQDRVTELTIPSAYFDLASNAPEGPAANVARLYAHFARDLRDGTTITPDFSHAAEQHRLLNAIETAARTGASQSLDQGGHSRCALT